MPMRFAAVIRHEGEWHVARCPELGVVTQGKTVEEAQANLKEAVELYLEDSAGQDYPESVGEIILDPLEVRGT